MHLDLRHSSWHAKSTIQSKQANGVISFYIWEEPLMPQQIFTARLEGFSFKNSSKQFTKKHEPYETQFISLLHSKASISMHWGWIVQVVSHLCSTVKSDQIPVAVYLVSAAAASSRQTSDLITNGAFVWAWKRTSNGWYSGTKNGRLMREDTECFC